MSDEIISIEEVIAYSLGTFSSLVEDWNGESDHSSITRTTGFRRARTSSPSRRGTGLTTPPPESALATAD